MFVCSVGNEKGGVGKTTLSINLAAYLAMRGQNVMLVDADAQAHASIGLNVKPAPGLYNLIVRDAEYTDVLVPIAPAVYSPTGTSAGRLMLLPGNLETVHIAQHVNEQGDLFLLHERFQQLEGRIDTIIIDTSPTPSLLHTSLYYATDRLIAPTEPEFYSISSLSSTMQRVQTFGAKRAKFALEAIGVAGIVPTMYSGSTIEHSENVKMLRSKYGDLLTEPVPVRTAWREASRERKSIFAYAPDSTACREALQLMARLEAGLNA